MDQQDTCLGCISLRLSLTVSLLGFSIGFVAILNVVLMFFVPFSYVFFGLQAILDYTAFMFFLLGVTFNAKQVGSTRKLVRKAMVYCSFLQIPAWASGLIFFLLNEEQHHKSVADFAVLSLAYTCLPLALFTTL